MANDTVAAVERTTLRARALRVREVLTGVSRERGLLKWFQDLVEQRTGGRRPSPTTVHRWFLEPPLRTIWPPALRVLDELEKEAVEVLRQKMREMEQ